MNQHFYPACMILIHVFLFIYCLISLINYNLIVWLEPIWICLIKLFNLWSDFQHLLEALYFLSAMHVRD